jgi:hypothetical protein
LDDGISVNQDTGTTPLTSGPVLDIEDDDDAVELLPAVVADHVLRFWPWVNQVSLNTFK